MRSYRLAFACITEEPAKPPSRAGSLVLADWEGKMHDSLVFGAEINPRDGDKLSN
jgi:hypothetical protein